MFRLLEKMADESVPVPETEPLNLHEDLKKLEDEINTLKQVKNTARRVKTIVGFGLERAASSRAEKEAWNHANAAAAVEIGRFWKVGNVCKSSRNVCQSVSRPI